MYVFFALFMSVGHGLSPIPQNLYKLSFIIVIITIITISVI